MRVLVVDDADTVRQRLTAAFRKASVVSEVTEASTGGEALAALQSFQPDLITLDLMLPGMSGMQVLESIREQDQDVKIVVFTNYPYATARRKSLSLGADFFFSKTTDLREVLSTVLSAVESERGEATDKDPEEGSG